VKHTFSSIVCLQNVVEYNPGFGNQPDATLHLIHFDGKPNSRKTRI